MGITKEVDFGAIEENVGIKGPRINKTRSAQRAVDEFLESGVDACEVDWRRISDDFDDAKRSLSYRVSNTKYYKRQGSEDVSVRSDRKAMRVYLVHAGRIGS